jgi:hypothetical protein
VALHTQREGADTAQRQEAAERVEYAAYRILQIAQLFRQFALSPTTASPATIGVAVQVFGRRVHHDIKPSSSGRWIAGEAKVLSATLIIVAARDRGDSAEIRQLQQRVGGVSTQIMRVSGGSPLQFRQIVGFHPAHLQTRAAAANVFQQAVSAAVDIIDRHQMAVFIQQLQHGGDGRQPGGKRVAAGAAFQFGNRRLQRMAGGLPLREYS